MKQETVEEFIKSYVNKIDRSEDGLVEQCLKDAIKWQMERSYSEEEVLEILKDFRDNIPNDVYVVDWFEKFKKK